MADKLIREKEQYLLIKVESTYATDPTPAAANAILAKNIRHSALEGSVEPRNNIRGFLGNSGSQRTSEYQSIEFDVELSGSGDVDTPPPYAILYLASGHAEAITADTQVAYTPISADYESAAIYYFAGDIRHVLLGVRGTIGLRLGTNGIPMLHFRGIGLYGGPTDAGVPSSVSWAAFKAPRPVNKATVPTCTFLGEDVEMADLTFDQANQVEYLNTVNVETVELVDRMSTMQIVFREGDVDTYDFWAAARNNTEGALEFQRGIDTDDDGYIQQLDIANLQVRNCQRVWRQGLAFLQVDADVVPLTANSDYAITHL